ncbi:MAG: hypothetical protein GY862_16385 [Gammaproteobacteria bacterium]|nr:hypothetical protein [Gammaproteobacteria bacterium]
MLTWEAKEWVEAFDKIRQKQDVFSIVNVLLLLLGFWQIGNFYGSNKRERLILTTSGIRYQSPLLSFRRRSKADWSIEWPEITSAYLKSAVLPFARGPLSIQLVLKTKSRTRKIIPCTWIDPATPKDSHPKLQWQTFTPAQTEHALNYCPVIKHLVEAGVEVDRKKIQSGSKKSRQKSKPNVQFDLLSNIHTRFALIAMFALIAYAALDSYIFNQETYAAAPFYDTYLLGGGLTAALAAIWLFQAKIPKIESILLALLLGGASGVSMVPGMLRMNQWTDTNGLQRYAYVVKRDFSLHPSEAGLPVIRLTKDLDYWGSLPVDSVYYIELRKGGLDFYQMNMAPIYKNMQTFVNER